MRSNGPRRLAASSRRRPSSRGRKQRWWRCEDNGDRRISQDRRRRRRPGAAPSAPSAGPWRDRRGRAREGLRRRHALDHRRDRGGRRRRGERRADPLGRPACSIRAGVVRRRAWTARAFLRPQHLLPAARYLRTDRHRRSISRARLHLRAGSREDSAQSGRARTADVRHTHLAGRALRLARGSRPGDRRRDRAGDPWAKRRRRADGRHRGSGSGGIPASHRARARGLRPARGCGPRDRSGHLLLSAGCGPRVSGLVPRGGDRDRRAQPGHDGVRTARRVPRQVRAARGRRRSEHSTRNGGGGRGLRRTRPQARARGPSEAGPHDVARISAPRHRAREARRSRRGRAARHGREGARMTEKILPTTTVGSFGKPDYLTKARAQQARGKLGATELEELERKATVEWIRRQEEIGLDVLVDGEMYRGDMVVYFAERLEGFTIGGLVRSYGNRYYHKPVISGKVRRPKEMTVSWFEYAQSLTDRPVKGMLTGPYTMLDWSCNEAYPTRRDAVLSLAEVIRDEARDLERAGAKYIQIDEPAIHARPEEIEIAIEAMGIVTGGLSAKTISHICYGDFAAIYPAVLELPVDQLDLAMANYGYRWLELFDRNPFTKELAIGIVDAHTHETETVDVAAEGIRKGLRYVAADKLWPHPDCGLKTRTVEECVEKCVAVVEATRVVRKELAKTKVPA